jgi:hypothetical protein
MGVDTDVDADRLLRGEPSTTKQGRGERGSRICVQGPFAGEEWNGREAADHHGGDDRG